MIFLDSHVGGYSFRCRWLVIWSRHIINRWCFCSSVLFLMVCSTCMLLAVWFCLRWIAVTWRHNSLIFRWSFLLLGWLFKRFLFSVWDLLRYFNGLTAVWECWIMVNAYEFDVVHLLFYSTFDLSCYWELRLGNCAAVVLLIVCFILWTVLMCINVHVFFVKGAVQPLFLVYVSVILCVCFLFVWYCSPLCVFQCSGPVCIDAKPPAV